MVLIGTRRRFSPGTGRWTRVQQNRGARLRRRRGGAGASALCPGGGGSDSKHSRRGLSRGCLVLRAQVARAECTGAKYNAWLDTKISNYYTTYVRANRPRPTLSHSSRRHSRRAAPAGAGG